MINSFIANIGTNDLKLNDHDTSSIEQTDLTKDEIKYLHQNLENSKTRLSHEKEKLLAIVNYIDANNYKEQKEDTAYLISFHVNFKDVFSLKEFNIVQKFNLMLTNEETFCGTKIKPNQKIRINTRI